MGPATLLAYHHIPIVLLTLITIVVVREVKLAIGVHGVARSVEHHPSSGGSVSACDVGRHVEHLARDVARSQRGVLLRSPPRPVLVLFESYFLLVLLPLVRDTGLNVHGRSATRLPRDVRQFRNLLLILILN